MQIDEDGPAGIRRSPPVYEGSPLVPSLIAMNLHRFAHPVLSAK